jgi:hypothetical protein
MGLVIKTLKSLGAYLYGMSIGGIMIRMSRPTKQKTTNAYSRKRLTKIVHTEHPLVGKQGEVIEANYPLLRIKISDGDILTLPISWTDYLKREKTERPGNQGLRISTKGLLEVVEIVMQAKQRK